MSFRNLRHALLTCVALQLVGCSSGSTGLDPQFATQREQLLLKNEPAEPLGILELREAGVSKDEVVLFGKIGSKKGTWSPGNAEFILSDPTAEIGGDHQCDGDCAFCKKKKQEAPVPYAIVQFTGDNGQLLAVDARRLLPVEESQTVVVRGTATVDSVGNLIVAANGIFIRR